jgi:nucleotide-binding universal stress UspA family protein/predicted Zn-ribbon and HTH transcriptional regulator
MFIKIYVPVDNSEYSNQAIDMALALAKPWHATIVGGHVYAAKMHDYRFKQMEYTLPEEYQDETELERQRKIHDSLITLGLQLISDSYLDVLKARCEALEVPFEAKTFDGKHYKVLADDITHSDYDLVVMGALGLGAVKDSQLGSVCERVVRRVQRDVLVVKHLEQPVTGGDRILVGIDGSPQSFGGLKTALQLGKTFGKTVEAVSVYDPFLHYVAFNGIVDVLSEQAAKVFRFKEQEQLHEEIIDTGLAKIYQSHLEVARQIADEDGVEIQLTLLPGKAFEKILQHARKVKPWLLVLGRIGIHSQSDDVDLGSNTENLLRLAPCHVLLSSSTHVPPLDLRAEESINWTDEAEARMARVPPLVKGIARTAILRFAIERGHSVVTSDVIEQAMEAFMPGYTGKMMGKVAKVLAIEKVRNEQMLTYICSVCGYTAKAENPTRCPVCKATAEQFQVIDRKVVEAIAEAEGATFEEDTFDGKKLKWTAEARRALREVTDAYLRRRAKARIEKVARMQKLAVITRDLALPLIGDTVGSERLAVREVSADHEGEAVTEMPEAAATQRVVSRPTHTQPSVSSKPHLNWTSDTGNLNEIAPGRVVVLAPPGHSATEASE